MEMTHLRYSLVCFNLSLSLSRSLGLPFLMWDSDMGNQVGPTLVHVTRHFRGREGLPTWSRYAAAAVDCAAALALFGGLIPHSRLAHSVSTRNIVR